MIHEFTIRTVADPEALPRVIGQLARNWVTPSFLESRLVDEAEFLIRFTTNGLSDEIAERVRATLGSFVLVRDVAMAPSALVRG